MNEQEIENIKEALREMMQLLVQRGQPLSDELKQKIAQVMEHAANRITALRQQEPQSSEPDQPPEEPQTIPETSRVNDGLGGAPSPDAQLLWILAGQQKDAFINYLNQFPTPETQALLNNPAELERVISFLGQMMPQEAQPVEDGIEHSDLNSSTIWGTQYDPLSKKMKVRFQGGSEYEYDGVPPNIYKAFSKGQASAKTDGQNQYGKWWKNKNPSMGAAMNQYIKAGGFNYRKLR